MRSWVWIFAVALAVPCAAAAQKFDLLCKATTVVSPTDETSSVSFRLRIDLAAKRYCRGDCEYVWPIQNVTTDLITFIDEKDRSSGNESHRSVSRLTGEYHASTFSALAQRLERTSGACEAAPFSGLPAPKF